MLSPALVDGLWRLLAMREGGGGRDPLSLAARLVRSSRRYSAEDDSRKLCCLVGLLSKLKALMGGSLARSGIDAIWHCRRGDGLFGEWASLEGEKVG